jgi:hypothetical protein
MRQMAKLERTVRSGRNETLKDIPHEAFLWSAAKAVGDLQDLFTGEKTVAEVKYILVVALIQLQLEVIAFRFDVTGS